MQPGYPGSGQDPYGQQPPYTDPYAQPQYQPQQPQPPADPTAPPSGQQPEQPPQYQAPYPPPNPAEAYPTSGYPGATPYPTSGAGYPGATPYPAAGYGAPMGGPPQQSNTQGLLALIFGIVSIPGVCCAILGLGLGVAAVILGMMGMKKANAGEASNHGQALAGVICGAIGGVLSIASIIASLAFHLYNFNFTTTP